MKIVALSGFLGLPKDWDVFPWQSFMAVDWQSFVWNQLGDWGAAFNDWAHVHLPQHNVLMGYSFGGRLALHALLDQPFSWQAAIIISTHVGLGTLQEREKRQLHDQEWAEKFIYQDWKSLMEDWNARKVFAQDFFQFQRRECDYQRCQLAKALRQGSLGKQADLREQIAALPMPILWITGDLDCAYCQIAQTLTFAHPHSVWRSIARAGHRVPWTQPQEFFDLVNHFLKKIAGKNDR